MNDTTTATTTIRNIKVEGTKLFFELKDQELINSEFDFYLTNENNIEFPVGSELVEGHIIVIDLEEFSRKQIDHDSNWTFFMAIKKGTAEVEKCALVIDKKIKKVFDRYFAPITGELLGLEKNDNEYAKRYVVPFINTDQMLSIVIRNQIYFTPQKLKTRVNLIKFKMKNGQISGKTYLEVHEKQEYTVKNVILKYRNKARCIEYNLKMSTKRIDKNTSYVNFEIDLSTLKLEPFYWDVYMIVEIDQEEFYVKVKKPSFWIENRISKGTLTNRFIQDGFLSYPYINVDGSLAFVYRKMEEYETLKYKYKEKFAYFLYRLFQFYWDRKDIWLGFEKFSETAHENGVAFFEYCMKNQKHKDFYYIIKKTSPEYENIRHLDDHVIDFMSLKYMIYLYAAKLLISSETRGHVYDVRI